MKNDAIKQYLSDGIDGTTSRQFERKLYRDDQVLEQFVQESEVDIRQAPFGFADAVMSKLTAVRMSVKVPMLSRKWCAAVCFCSVAAIALLSITGYGALSLDFLIEQPARLSEFLGELNFR